MGLFDNFDEEDLELNSLGCPLWAENDLEEILDWMKEDVYIYTNKQGFSYQESNKFTNKKIFPRFGIYSNLLKKMSVFIFDHPQLEKKLGKTACTDGLNIFINLDFYKKLYQEEHENEENRLGIVPLVLHELSHIVENDFDRLVDLPPHLSNIIQDLYTNAYLKKSFPQIKWLPSLMGMGYGLKKGDEHYATQSSERILIEVANKLNHNILPPLTKEEEETINSPYLLKEERGRSIENIDPTRSLDEKHIMKTQEIVDALLEAGLDNVVDKLGLTPYKKTNNDDLQKDDNEINKIENLNKKNIKDAISEIQELQRKTQLNKNNSPAGKATYDASERMSLKKKSLITWKQIMIEKIFGEGSKEVYHHDQPNDLFFVDEITEMLGFPLYQGIHLKEKNDNAILVVLDTSGSMKNDDLSRSLTEIMSLKNSAQSDNNAADVIVVFADVNAKENNVLVINEDNYLSILNKKEIDVIGRGGTNLTNSINQSFSIKEIKDKNLSAVLVFTDLGDQAPLRSDLDFEKLKNKNVSFNYVSVNTSPLEIASFKEKVKDYANVVPLVEHQIVDLDKKISPLKPVNANKKPSYR